jgi:hypothetical protein
MRNCASEVWSGACHRAAQSADPLGPSRNDEQLAAAFGTSHGEFALKTPRADPTRPMHRGLFEPILRLHAKKRPSKKSEE